MKHLHWPLIVGAPLLLMAGYWMVIDDRTGMLDWIILAAGIGIGLVGIWLAPWRRGAQIGATLAYVPVMGFVLAASVLFLECSTGHCL